MSGSLWVGNLLFYAQFCKEQSAAVYFFSFHVTPNRNSQACRDAADVPVSIDDKTCRSSLDHFNLMFLVSLVLTQDNSSPGWTEPW